MRTLFDHLRPKFPILNAGMGGGLAGAELVAAVNNAGGLGILGVGATPPDLIRQMVDLTRTLTSRPIGANVIMPMSDGSDIEACFDAGVEVLVLFWGDPQPFVEDSHKRGMFVISQCGDASDASDAADAGVDAVIIQGKEAGGHVKATEPLVDTLRTTVASLGSVPVIAAGGITSGEHIATVLAAGASAASLGTRFVASTEARALKDYKQRITAARSAETVLTKLFDVGWPEANHRVIRNSTFEAWEAAGRPPSGARPGEGEQIGTYAIGGAMLEIPRYAVYPASEGFTGDIEATALYAGESVETIDSILPVSEIMTTLVEELRDSSS